MIGIPDLLLLMFVAGGLLQLWGRTGAVRTAIRPTGLAILFFVALLHGLQIQSGFSLLSTADVLPSENALDRAIQQRAVWIACGMGATLLLIDSARRAVSAGPILMAVAAIGAIAACDSMIWLVVGLHVVAFATVLLIQTHEVDNESSIPGADGLLFQATCLALFLFGLSLLFAQTGTLSLAEMRMHFLMGADQADETTTAGSGPAIATSVLIIAGLLGFAGSAWLPWGAQRSAAEARLSVAAAISLLPTVTVLLIMLRLVPGLLSVWEAEVITIVMIAALLLMGVGLLAVWVQTNLRGMLGWAIVVHAGLWFGLLTVAGWDAIHPEWSLATESGLPGGYMATLIAVTCDAAAMLGVWATLSWLAGERNSLRHPDELCGLLRQRPLAGAVMSICLLSLCGAPFLAGFWGRFWSLTAMFGPRQASSLTGLYEPHFGFLFLLAVSAAAHIMLCGLYLRLLQRIVLEHSLGRIRSEGGMSALVCATLLAGALILAGLWPVSLMRAAMPGDTPYHPSPATPIPGAPDVDQPTSPAGARGGQRATVPEDASNTPPS